MALLTTTAAARRCGVCPRTVLRWLTGGELAGIQTAGGHWRVEEAVLSAFLAGSRPDARDAGELRVAIIEDDPSQAEALARVVSLLAPAARIERAGDGLAAGLVLGALLPDVAFVDFEMPNLDGIEVIRRARGVAGLAHTRFVVVSGKLTPERIAALRKLGASDVLAKPIHPEAIRAFLSLRPIGPERVAS